METFEDESMQSGKKAWFGYIRSFSLANKFFFLHSKGQRKITCKRCGIKIPKELPRFNITGSWNYYVGHYCLKHGLEKIEESIAEKQVLVQDLQSNLKDLKSLVEIATPTTKKEKYKELIAIATLVTKLEPSRR